MCYCIMLTMLYFTADAKDDRKRFLPSARGRPVSGTRHGPVRGTARKHFFCSSCGHADSVDANVSAHFCSSSVHHAASASAAAVRTDASAQESACKTRHRAKCYKASRNLNSSLNIDFSLRLRLRPRHRLKIHVRLSCNLDRSCIQQPSPVSAAAEAAVSPTARHVQGQSFPRGTVRQSSLGRAHRPVSAPARCRKVYRWCLLSLLFHRSADVAVENSCGGAAWCSRTVSRRLQQRRRWWRRWIPLGGVFQCLHDFQGLTTSSDAAVSAVFIPAAENERAGGDQARAV